MDLVKYKQGTDTWGSHHFPIEFDMKVEAVTYRNISNRISNKKTDWNRYVKILIEKKDLQGKEYMEMSAEEKYNRVIKIMKEAMRKTSGKKQTSLEKDKGGKRVYKRKRNPVSW